MLLLPRDPNVLHELIYIITVIIALTDTLLSTTRFDLISSTHSLSSAVADNVVGIALFLSFLLHRHYVIIIYKKMII